MTDTPPPCRDCKCSPCNYVAASYCERLREWQKGIHPNTKWMAVMFGIQLIMTLIILFVLLHLAYVGDHLISEKYDSEIVDMAQAAFYLGGMIGGVAMVAITTARSVMGVAADLCVRGLKLLKAHITGETQNHSTQAQLKGGGG